MKKLKTKSQGRQNSVMCTPQNDRQLVDRPDQPRQYSASGFESDHAGCATTPLSLSPFSVRIKYHPVTVFEVEPARGTCVLRFRPTAAQGVGRRSVSVCSVRHTVVVQVVVRSSAGSLAYMDVVSRWRWSTGSCCTTKSVPVLGLGA